MFILKEEGFYLDLCPDYQQFTESQKNLTRLPIIVKQPIAVEKLSTTLNTSVYDIDNAQYVTNTSHENNSSEDNLQHSGTRLSGECKEQAAKLNLWFSAAVSFMYLAFTGVGFLTKKLGTRLTRCMFM